MRSGGGSGGKHSVVLNADFGIAADSYRRTNSTRWNTWERHRSEAVVVKGSQRFYTLQSPTPAVLDLEF